MRTGARVFHSDGQQDRKARAARSKARHHSRLRWLATPGAALRQRHGPRTLPDRRDDHGGGSAAYRAGESHLRAGGVIARRRSHGKKDYRESAAGREILHGGHRAWGGDAAGGRTLSGSHTFWAMLCHGRYAGRNEGVFGETGGGVQREVTDVVQNLEREFCVGGSRMAEDQKFGKIDGGLSADGLRFGIVVSRFNSFITERLLQGSVDALERAGASSKHIDVAHVPGSFELPLTAKRLATGGKY